MAINKEEIKKYIVSILTGINDANAQQKLQGIVKYLSENYSQLDLETKKYVDNSFDEIYAQMHDFVNRLPESPQKKEFLRGLDKYKGKYVNIEPVIDALGKPITLASPTLGKHRKVFSKIAQSIIDLLYETTKNTMRGKIETVCLVLLYNCVDELITSFHLTQHGYVIQAYAHIRTVFEALDKIELFIKEPKWIDVWAGNDQREILNKLSPSQIRIKLGKPKYDPLYSLLSEIGIHTGFKNFQARTSKSIELSDKGNPKATVWFGGCPKELHIHAAMLFGVYAALLTFLEIHKVYSHYLDQADFDYLLISCINETKPFIEENMDDFVKGFGLKREEVEKIFKDSGF